MADAAYEHAHLIAHDLRQRIDELESRNAPRGVATGGSRCLMMAAIPSHMIGREAMTTKKKKATKKTSTRTSTAKKAAPTKTAKAKPAAKKTDGKRKKLSAIAAAAQVLSETKQPMTTRQLIEAMAANNLWTSPGGRTPWATLYSAIQRELQAKGKESRFVKIDRGQFRANG
jgi:hypothetical protein